MDDLTANPVAGEIEFSLNGEPVILRPSFDAITAIEARLGMGLLDLYGRATAMKLTTHEIGVILTECIRAAGRAHSQPLWTAYRHERVAEEAWKGGIMKAVTDGVVPFLTAALNGGAEPKKAEAAEMAETAALTSAASSD